MPKWRLFKNFSDFILVTADTYVNYLSITLRNLVLFLLQMLFLRINASYKLHLKKQLSHLNVINDGGPQNGYVFKIFLPNAAILKSLICCTHYAVLFHYSHSGVPKL